MLGLANSFRCGGIGGGTGAALGEQVGAFANWRASAHAPCTSTIVGFCRVGWLAASNWPRLAKGGGQAHSRSGKDDRARAGRERIEQADRHAGSPFGMLLHGCSCRSRRSKKAVRARHGSRLAHTLYKCPSCGERLVGERRCPDCNLFSRAIGLGGHCPECDAPLLLLDLLGEEVVGPTELSTAAREWAWT